MWRGLVMAVSMLAAASAGASPDATARTGGGCHVPRLAGLTLHVAESRAAHAGCRLRVRGAAVEDASIQTILRQSPPAARRSARVTVWLNRLCSGSAAYAPELVEPAVRPGPTGLVSGFYVVGGPLVRFSAPGCVRPAPPAQGGTVEVTNASGVLVATQTSSTGRLAEIALPAGAYTITGTFLGAEFNGVPPTQTDTVVIPPGQTVRQDFFLDVP